MRIIFTLILFCSCWQVFGQKPGNKIQPLQLTEKKFVFIYSESNIPVNDLFWEDAEDFVNGFAMVYKDQKNYFVDAQANQLNHTGYDMVRNFVNHRAAVMNGNKWGFIDENGKELIPLQYESVHDFRENAAIVFTGSRWLEIDSLGNLVRNFDYDPIIREYQNKVKANPIQVNAKNIQGVPWKNEYNNKPTASYHGKLLPNNVQTGNCPPNIDFEFGNFTNWTCFVGKATCTAGVNTVTNIAVSPPIPGRHTIVPRVLPSLLDPFGLFPTNPPDGSNFCIRLGNPINGSQAERVRYVITVPTNAVNYSVTYQYAVVFQDPGHLPCQQPRFSATLYDTAAHAYIPCGTHDYVSTSNIPGFFTSIVDTSVKYKPWSPAYINLTPYAGKTLFLDFTTEDCTLGQHWGYAYIDVNRNCQLTADVQYECAPPNITTLTAPGGFQFYNWWDQTFTNLLGTGQTLVLNPGPPIGTTLWVEVIPYAGFGCIDTLPVTITTTFPVAGFTIPPSQCLNGNNFTFTSTSTVSSGSITGLNWDFGDGTTGTGSPVTHSYAAVGTYNVKLVVTASTGCQDSITQVVTVNPMPIAAFTGPPSQCLIGNIFSFTSTSSISSGSIATCAWNFGDGATATGITVTHTYATAGTFTVKLVVTSDHGCTDSTTQQITVDPKPLPAFAIPAAQCLSGNSYTFISTSTISTGSITGISWNFGDGSTATGSPVSHTYVTAGTFIVKLLVTSDKGCTDSLTQIITVNPQPIAAFAVPPGQCLSGNNFSFTSTSSVNPGSISTQTWYFGDGATGTGATVTHTYATAGTYNVKLVVVSNNGCADSLTQLITVNPQPIAAFTVPASQCLSGNSFSFTSTSTVSSGTISTIVWNFGDGSTASGSPVSHTYAIAGNYNVKLIVTSNNGCTDSITQAITVNPQPVAAFAAPAGQCLSGNSFSFTSTSSVSSGSISSQVWNFGDGATATGSPVTHTYATAGTYNVKLLVTTNNGCTDSITRTITVNPQPVAAFAAPASQCLSGNSFSFTSTSSVSSGSIITTSWNFGDGGTATGVTVTHTYATAGTYVVKLLVTTNNGCRDSITNTITVNPQPAAAFTVPAGQCLSGNSFSFTSTSTISSGSILSHAWDFGDGTTATGITVTHTYATAGTFNVKLVVVSNNGCSDSITKMVTVNPQPVAAFAVPAGQCLSGNSFSFTSTSSVSSGAITNHSWDFGDGGTATGITVTHTYAVAGTYNVKLVVTTNNGCKDSIIKTVTIAPQPIAAFAAPASQCLSGNSFSFTSTSSVNPGSITALNWNFGDGGTATGVTVTHTYAVSGTYNVKLLVTTNNGCLDSITKTITVNPQPVAAFAAPASQCLSGNNFSFTSTSTVSSGSIISSSWDFGDGSTATGITVTHTYATAGTYTVKLLVNSNNGCTDSISRTVIVNPQPVAAFAAPASQCLSGNSFSFTSTSSVSSGSITNQTWYFGDGGTATGVTVTHTYATAGTYVVKLLVTTNNGCRDSITNTITVNPQPAAAFVAPAGQCLSGNIFSFTSTSTVSSGSIISHAWDFGDGSTATGINVTHTYAAAGTYNVKLLVITNNGCRDSITKTVIVNPQPVAAFAVPAGQCLSGNSFTFTSTSSVSTGSITNHAWDFGDGGAATGITVTHTYAVAGTYNVKLVVTTNNGCKDSIIKTVTIASQPIAAFAAPASQCLSGNSFSFTSTSTVNPGSITSLNWNFGDGATATGVTVTHTYANSGTYNVKLLVTTNNGCIDSITKQITVNPQPVAAFTAPAGQCFSSNNFSFTSNSTVSSGSIISHVWYFGDGSTATGVTVTHTYAQPGTYNVKLLVTTNNGCTDSITKTVTIAPQPVAAFAAPASQCLSGNSFSFTSTSSVSSGSITSVDWNFGDGTTGNGVTVTHTYAASGTYTVKLVVTTNSGCKDSINNNITVNPQPAAAFTAPAGQCLSGNSFSFTSTSTVSSGSIISHAWNFGDGSGATGITVTHTYATAGTYTVKLVVITTFGCRDSISKTVTVNPQPVANFTLPGGQCLSGNNFSFTSTSTVSAGTITASDWDFGDGTTGSGVTVTHTYATAGSYNVKLVVTTNNGCKDSIIRTITLAPQPIAAFAAPAGQCLSGNNFSFTSTSTVNGGSIVSLNWYFGDGATASGVTVNHTYATAGTFNVKLLVTTNNGCTDSITKPITVEPQPVAAFTSPAGQCLTGNNFSFTSNSTVSSGTISTHAWDFGDGQTATGITVTHTYAVAGTYNVELLVTTNNGCRDSITKTVTIAPQPIAAFAAPAGQCLSGNNFSFTSTSTVSTGSITAVNWDFGDGATGNGITVSHTYAAAGTYNVKLLVTTNNGCTDSITRPITVNPQPVAAFAAPAGQCLSGNNFSFTSTSTVSSGTIIIQHWDFGDGSSATGVTVNHTYATAGTYNVKLLVTTNNGCIDSITQVITIQPQPAAIFNAPAGQCLTGNNFSFTSTSTVSSGTIVASDWYFGDGASANGVTVSHTYAAAGTYAVKLVVTTNNGCKDSLTKTITVAPQPVANFAAPAMQCLSGNNFSFTSTSTGTINVIGWNFGDGSSSTGTAAVVTHSYAAAGTYTVKLTVTTINGCIDSISKQVTVQPQPIAAFPQPAPQCLINNNFNFTSTSSGSIASSTWYFGDGSMATGASVNHSYAAAGTYTVKLLVITNNGCRDSLTRTATTTTQPIGAINVPSSLNICLNIPVLLTASGGVTYQWFLNNQLIPGVTGPTYPATQPGVYSVLLVNAVGCTNQAVGTVTLAKVQPPFPDFNFQSYCIGLPVQFNNMSSTTGTGPTLWHWDFGDGMQSTQVSPTHTYLKDSGYLVTLKVSPVFCPNMADSVIKYVHILAPIPGIRYPTVNALANVNSYLQARTFGTQYLWTPATGLSNVNISNPYFHYDRPTDYVIRIQNPSGCTTYDSVLIRIFDRIDLQVPKAFTPNGDGHNDKLDVFLIGIRQLVYFRVFNRWGQLLFETTDRNQLWDGTFRGTKQPLETYVWMAQAIGDDGTVITRRGETVLIR